MAQDRHGQQNPAGIERIDNEAVPAAGADHLDEDAQCLLALCAFAQSGKQQRLPAEQFGRVGLGLQPLFHNLQRGLPISFESGASRTARSAWVRAASYRAGDASNP